ncbi:HAMP domain-containing protein [Salmonella enterica]|nr:HAMP domain-containing protein [Salmonella enterica]
MFNRIRVVTMLMMVLGVFALLQLVSGGLLFSSLQHNQQGFVISNELRQQQSELTSTWDLMLQTRINLSRSAARMMMDASNQQSSAKTDLLQNAKTTLAQAAAHYANFKNMTPLPAMAEASANVDEKYQRYQAALAELIQFLDHGNMDAYFAQPTQGMQNALGEALGNYARVSENLYRQTFDQSAHDYRFAQWQLGVLAVVLVLILMVVWFGIRHALLNPLARVITHIREIASGDLTKTLTVSGRNEIGELAGTVEHMQRSLIDTVTQVREGSDAIYSGTSEIAAGNTDLSSRTEQQASALEETAASMEQLTATVKQNADNARQASQLAQSAGETMTDIVNAVTRVTDIMGEIASASDEQSRGIDQVALAVSEMDRVTQQNASLVQESAAAAAALEEQASRLTQAVSAFRLASRPLVANKPEMRLSVDAQSGNTPRSVAAGDDANWETF